MPSKTDNLPVERRATPDRRAKPEPGRRTEGFSLQFVCVLLDIHYNTLRNWVNRGYIRAYRVGPHLLRIPRSEIPRMRKIMKTPYVHGLKRYSPVDPPSR